MLPTNMSLGLALKHANVKKLTGGRVKACFTTGVWHCSAMYSHKSVNK